MTQTTRLTATRRRAAVVADLVAQRPTTTATAVEALSPPTRRCSICSDPPVCLAVDEALATKTSQRLVAERVGKNHKAIEKHWKVCRMSSVDVCREAAREIRAAARQGTATPPPASDFAAMVRDAAAQKLMKGELTITAQHGLQAQGLIDRREERRQDRDLTLSLARLISGASFGPPTTVIDVTPNTPLSLIDPDAP